MKSRKKMKGKILSLCLVTGLLMFGLLAAGPVMAQTTDVLDPTFTERGSDACPGTVWCTGFNPSYQDPISGKNTLVYFMNLGPSMVPGDWLIDETTTPGSIGDVVRFEVLSGTAVAFIFSDDTGGLNPSGGTPHPADVGLPSTFQTNHYEHYNDATGAGTGFVYQPTTTQPGYVPGSTVKYGLQGSFDYPVPEPTTMLLLGFGLVGIAGLKRKFNR